MAARMTDIVKQRGRAYRCLACNFTTRKCRIEEHFFKRHVTEHQVPFLCSVCDFRTGDNSKFVRHQESPGHLSRVEPLENLVALQESSTPRYMVMGQDVEKLSKEESSEHWLSVGWMQVEDEEAKEEEEVEDLRPQLLRHEPMQLTPPQSQKVSRSMATDAPTLTEVASQTEQVYFGERLEKVDTNISFMYNQMREALQSMYSMHENLKVVNRRQEEVILRLEKRLDECDAREKKEEERSRSGREERGRYDRDERRRRDDRDRSQCRRDQK